MANKALFWYNYKRFVDEGTIKPLSPKTFALSGLITVCGLVLSLTIYCLVFPNSFVGENTPIKLFFCTLFYMLGTLAMIGGVYFGIALVVRRFIPDKLCNISGQCKSAVMAYGASSIAYSVNKEFEEEINKIPIVNQYYNIRLVDVQNYYYRLAYARLLSEKKYVDFKESAPELFSALRDNSDITSAKIMIAKLEKVLTDV